MNKLLLSAGFYWLCIAITSAQVISEIQYKTPGINNADDEWIEICNPTATDVDISNYQVFVGTTLRFTFPSNTMFLGDDCLTLALRDDGDDTNSFNDSCPFTPDYVISNVTINGSTTSPNVLTNSNTHTIELKNGSNTTVDKVMYNGNDIPSSEEGKTLTLADLSEDNLVTSNGFPWVFSNDFGGSPGLPGNVFCPSSSTVVEFRSSFIQIEESAGTISSIVCVNLQRPSPTEPTTVEVKLDGGTATNGVDSENFDEINTLTFPAGSLTQQCIEITIINDEENEGNEVFNFSLQNPTGGRNTAELGDNTNFSLVILEDDFADVNINEVLFNPPGTNGDREFIELKGTPNANLAGITLLYIDGDAGSVGKIQEVIDLGDLDGRSVALGTNGIALIHEQDRPQDYQPLPANATNRDSLNLSFQTGTATFLLVTNYQNTSGDSDLDDDNNGILDAILWDTVLDAVSISDGGTEDLMYAATLGGVDIPDNTIGNAEAIFRDDAGIWHAGTIEGGTTDFQFNLDDAWDSSNQLVDLTQYSPTFLTPGEASQPSPPLAVHLFDFKAFIKKDAVFLEWKTSQEKDNNYFIIERSQNGIDFKTIGQIKGQPNINQTQYYSFIDYKSLEGINYYRLGWIDKSGKIGQSTVIKINHTTNNEVIIYPTITQDLVNITSVANGSTIRIFNAFGQLVQQEKLQQSTIDISSLSSGIYILQINQRPFKIIKL